MESIVQNSIQNLSGLSVLDTPIYLIGITAIFGLIKLPNYEITNFHWFLLYGLFILILLMCIGFVLVKQNHVTKHHELKVKLSRSGSIVAAIAAIMFAGDEALRYPFLFYLLGLLVVVQVIVFALYLLKKDHSLREDDQSQIMAQPSFLQLTLLTSALIIGIAKNSHNFGEHLILSDTKLENFYKPRADNLHAVDASLTKALDDFIVENNKSKSSIQEREIRERYSNILTFEEVTNRYHGIGYSLVGLWLLCISIWIYVLFFKELKLTRG